MSGAIVIKWSFVTICQLKSNGTTFESARQIIHV